MIELGKRDKVAGADSLRRIKNLYDRPLQWPKLTDDEVIICGYDQGLGERLIVCEDLDEMQTLYDAYARGGAIHIKWYRAIDPGFIYPLAKSNL